MRFPTELPPHTKQEVAFDVVVDKQYPVQKVLVTATVGEDAHRYLLLVHVEDYVPPPVTDVGPVQLFAPRVITFGKFSLDDAVLDLTRTLTPDDPEARLRLVESSASLAGMPIRIEQRDERTLIFRGDLRDVDADAAGFYRSKVPVDFITGDKIVRAEVSVVCSVIGR